MKIFLRITSLLFVILSIMVAVYLGYSVPYYGFGGYTLPNGDYVPPKNMWDWLQLLYVPTVAVMLNVITYRDKIIEVDRQQEVRLQSYLDRMEDLLLEKKLRTTKNAQVRDVARTRTLTVLRGLDAQRKKLVILFLHEAGLILGERPIISLSDADLSNVDFREVYLSNVNLAGSDLRNAHLDQAFWSGANLSATDLRNTDLRRAMFRVVDLSHADLRGADLRGADLTNSNLTGTTLTGAKVSYEQLAKAFSLNGATMPDGTKHS